MTIIVCDVCKKEIEGARRDLNYYTLLEKDVCIPCKDEMDVILRAELRARSAAQTVAFLQYKEFMAQTLKRLCGD